VDSVELLIGTRGRQCMRAENSSNFIAGLIKVGRSKEIVRRKKFGYWRHICSISSL
jgi:hypothetical protein